MKKNTETILTPRTHANQKKSKPKHKLQKPHPIYVKKQQQNVISSPQTTASEPPETFESRQAEKQNLEEHLVKLSQTYEDLQSQYEIADDDFKSMTFIKSKIERERNSLGKQVKEKTELLQKLTECAQGNSKEQRETNDKIDQCDSEATKLQNESTKVLQDILSWDKEIQLIQNTHKRIDKTEKGVNTIFDDESYKQNNSNEKPKISSVNKEMEMLYESYADQLEGAKEQLKNVDENLLQAKEKEELLLEQKAEIEEQLEELKSVIRAFNKYEEKLGPEYPRQREINPLLEKDEKVADVLEKLTHFKRAKRKLASSLEETKLGTSFYKLATIISVFFMKAKLNRHSY